MGHGSGELSGFYIPSIGGGALFAGCFAAWALFETWTNLKTWPAGSLNRDQLSRYVIIVVVGASFGLGVAATWAHACDLTLARPQTFYAGLALMAAGLVFRAYAIQQLGRYFTPEVTVQPGQRVVDRGLYRYLRHPSYTGRELAFATRTAKVDRLALMLQRVRRLRRHRHATNRIFQR